MQANASVDFGYPWWLSYGHLLILLPAAAILLWGYSRKWSRWPMAILTVLVLWSGAGFVITRFLFNANGTVTLPTNAFLRQGRGRVLDMGCGTGRSSIMVLQSRPEATLVALDEFGESFHHHFGEGQSPQQRLFANLDATGVRKRVTVETADMRKLPFEPASFDAIVSAYAIDHLNREGISMALLEAARVVKPGGDFLLILIANDAWARFAFGPMLSHGGTRGAAWWTTRLEEAGFRVVEQGTRPITLYLLARR